MPARPDLPQIWTRIRELALDAGFARSGVAELKRPLSIDLYRAWLDKGYAGEMRYLKRHLPIKENPALRFGRARAALVVAVDYLPHPEPAPTVVANRIARYARGRDYHRWLARSLNELCLILRAEFAGEEFLCCTDSAPILERDLAARAGLGWVGKNGCVIDRGSGSLFLIGEIVTTLAAPVADAIPRDHCGACSRCIDACPTGALRAPRELDARLCISYLTIEARAAPPVELRAPIGDWLFGCDVCQTVCPWNVKAFGPALDELEPPRAATAAELARILKSSNRELERAFADTALARAEAVGLKRNALVVAANLGLGELREEIAAYADHAKLGELARWALDRLAEPGAAPSISLNEALF